jgi:predicted RNA-binding protein YlxR (DUF448 family)
MPIRTSIVSGKKDNQTSFWRLTIQDQKLVFDGKKKNSGRGIYLEKNINLIKKLLKLKGKISYILKEKDFNINEEDLKKTCKGFL